MVTIVTRLGKGTALTWAEADANFTNLNTFTQSGTGAVDRVAQDKMRDIVSVKDFGVTADGVTDDTLALQAALAAANGKILQLPVGGTILVQSATTLASGNNVSIEGNGCTIKAGTSLTLSGTSVVLWQNATGFFCRNVVFDFNSRTCAAADAVIAMAGCSHFKFQANRIINATKVGLAMSGCSYFELSGNYLEKTTADTAAVNQALMIGVTSSPSNFGTVKDNVCVKFGIICVGAGVIFKGNRITDWRYGAGISIAALATSLRCSLIGNYCSSGYVGLDGDSLTIKGLEVWGAYNRVIGNHCEYNSGPGIFIGGQYSVVADNICNSNCTYDSLGGGITAGYLDATYNANDSAITGNRCFDILGASGTQKYGMQINASCDRVFTAANNLAGNKTGDIDTGGKSHPFVGKNQHFSFTWNPASVAPGASVTNAQTVAGAEVGDFVSVSCSGNLLGMSVSGYVSGTNDVVVVIANNSAGAVDIGSSTFRVLLTKPLL